MIRNFDIEIKVEDNIRFDDFARVFDDTMPGFINAGLYKVQGEAQQNSPVYRSLFRGSIQTAVEQQPATIRGFVFSSINYAPIIEGVDEAGNDVEFGRRPGAAFPNLGELKLWVERVISPPVEKLDDVTYRVGRKISTQGIKAKRPIGNAFERNRDFVNREIDRGVKEVFDQL
ncbi:MAG TPA: hypothetical protein VJ464_15855 [Blastocatellia bacterium]|nr:hypothetical protein [Blastocatellia bacterium]